MGSLGIDKSGPVVFDQYRWEMSCRYDGRSTRLSVCKSANKRCIVFVVALKNFGIQARDGGLQLLNRSRLHPLETVMEMKGIQRGRNPVAHNIENEEERFAGTYIRRTYRVAAYCFCGKVKQSKIDTRKALRVR